MQFQEMDTRITRLMDELEDNGWEQFDPDVSSDWWFDQIIGLRSNWNPMGLEVYLTCLVDPMHTDLNNRKAGEDVWAVAIGNRIPADRLDHLDSWSLTELNSNNPVILALNQLRNST